MSPDLFARKFPSGVQVSLFKWMLRSEIFSTFGNSLLSFVFIVSFGLSIEFSVSFHFQIEFVWLIVIEKTFDIIEIKLKAITSLKYGFIFGLILKMASYKKIIQITILFVVQVNLTQVRVILKQKLTTKRIF